MDAIIISIVGWIITILIAVYAARSGSKDIAKKLAALEESTTKQVESIKELTRLQIESTIKNVELEIEKNLLYAKQAKQEWEGIDKINNSAAAYNAQFKEMRLQDFREQKPERDYDLYCKFIKDLEAIKQNLEVNKKKLN